MSLLQEKERFKEALEEKGIKNTKHRIAILGILAETQMPLTAEEVFLNLKDKDISIWISTVYRTLETLSAKGLTIKSSFMDDGKARYQLNQNEHKHHLICIKCHKMIPIDECPFHDIEEELKDKVNFQVIGHKFEIYGYCSECKSLNR
ncbi:Fur family transcriptional regulator [Haloimpatiens lingqiaonensis]|uniref:Fur family transcriptional regulator n=1 Tax=Haloimpatiens lingqiaonensis TaxID=1380675 RepID=UPI0010FD8BE3|nr:transcriptional repressor [Haloimpatiens lingqiaonensis]